jgi:hypothetical protein
MLQIAEARADFSISCLTELERLSPVTAECLGKS